MSYEEGSKKAVSVGPWGCQDGYKWDDGVYSTVRQLVIAHGGGIDSIQIEYDAKGYSVWSDRHGGNGGRIVDKINLDYPDEYLTSVHGHYGSINAWGPVLIRSLTFESNQKKYGPYGMEQGTRFSFPMTGGKIVGFHGKSGWYLDAIGVYLKPHYTQKQSKALVHSQSCVATETEKTNYSIIQGSIGQNFDIVLAVKQKDQDTLGSKLSWKTSASKQFNEIGNKGKIHRAQMPMAEQLLPKLSPKIEGLLTAGPWGGSGGTPFDDGIYNGIKQINISRNVGAVSIRVLYDRDGQAVWGSKNGGTGGFRTDKIVFEYPKEVLTHITGTYEPLMYMGPSVIRSITFHTNKGRHGPYGEEQGTAFTSREKEGKIVGFHGRNGLFLDAIGIHMIEGKVTPLVVPPPSINNNEKTEANVAEAENNQWSNKLALAKREPAEEMVYKVVKEPAPCGPGPWGGDGGRPWDDGVFSGIKQIYLTRDDVICSIQIEYDRNGQSVWSVKHGGNGGTTTHRIKIEYPNEVLNCICGYYGPVNKGNQRSEVIRSLTMYTTRGKYGPFGEETGTFFSSTTTEGKVVGFHGRSGLYLDAIGVHMQHWLGNQRPVKSSLFKKFYL